MIATYIIAVHNDFKVTTIAINIDHYLLLLKTEPYI